MNKNVPNIITMSRVILTPIMILFFLLPLSGGVGYFIAAGIFIVGSFSDALDGHLARKYNLVSNLGKMLDAIADKFIQTSAIFLVLVTSEIFPIWISTIVILVILLRDVWINAIRQICATNGIIVAADFLGKLKSIFLDIATAIIMVYVGLNVAIKSNITTYVLLCGISFLLVGVALSVISCVNYTIKCWPAMMGKKTEEK